MNSIISIENSLLFIGLVSVLLELDYHQIKTELDPKRIKALLNSLEIISNRIIKNSSWLITLFISSSGKTDLHSIYRICQVRAP